MATLEVIYCAGKNRTYAELAIEAGFSYGAQLPNPVYFAPVFVDQDYQRPDLTKYLEAVKQYKPRIATVLDWESKHSFETVIMWAEEIAPYVETVIIIPKVPGGVHRIPQAIGGKPVRLGYSVMTRYGGTAVPIWEFARRPVHLLGGSPQKQMRLYRMLNVTSVDGNMIQERAHNGQYWTAGDATQARNRYFPQIQEMDGWTGADMPSEAFRRSCANVMKTWRRVVANTHDDLPLFSILG